MADTRIHVLHTGSVCIAPALAFGGPHTNPIQASGIFDGKKDRIWLPVSVYYVESPHGKILFDTGWNRAMSPNGELDKSAQIHSLGGIALYEVNQGVVPLGQAVDEQLAELGVAASDLDLVLLSHLDCGHANGLNQVKDAKRILVSKAELDFVNHKTPINRIRFNDEWWDGVNLETFEWNGTEGPFGCSYDVFGDGRFVMIYAPGHTEGHCVQRIKSDGDKYVQLFADAGYAKLSWEALLTSGIASDKKEQKKSLEWVREMSLDPNCVESLATHDPDVVPHVIDL